MPFVFNIPKGVPRATEAAVLKLAKRLEKATQIKHPVPVFVTAMEVIPGAHDEHGNFWYCDSDNQCWISLAGLAKRSTVESTFAHEVAHYEQWRDGKPVQERGIEVRARTLLKLAKAGK